MLGVKWWSLKRACLVEQHNAVRKAGKDVEVSFRLQTAGEKKKHHPAKPM
jgi:hypothetical protein